MSRTAVRMNPALVELAPPLEATMLAALVQDPARNLQASRGDEYIRQQDIYTPWDCGRPSSKPYGHLRYTIW
jgi:hypothetical protein